VRIWFCFVGNVVASADDDVTDIVEYSAQPDRPLLLPATTLVSKEDPDRKEANGRREELNAPLYTEVANI